MWSLCRPTLTLYGAASDATTAVECSRDTATKEWRRLQKNLAGIADERFQISLKAELNQTCASSV